MSTIECYDCHQRVRDLKLHRETCKLSRRSKSLVKATTPSVTISDFKNTTDVYMLLDVSGSMQGRKLNDAKTALKQSVDTMSMKDRLSIVTFDSKPYFKLKPRSVEQILRQGELNGILDRIFAGGSTALYDSIKMVIEQRKYPDIKTVIVALTDGMDNASSTTYEDILALVSRTPNLEVNIIQIDGSTVPEHKSLCQGGEYVITVEERIIVEITRVIRKYSVKE